MNDDDSQRDRLEHADPDADLDARLTRLPKGLTPPQDGWSRIEARLGPASASTAASRAPGGWSGFGPRASLAMAASLAALAVVVALGIDPGEPPRVATGPSSAEPVADTPAPTAAYAGMPQVMPASLGGDATMGEAFNSTRAALREDFGRRVEQLDPSSRELVLANMQVIDDALARISLALEANPRSAVLQDLLITTYQKELAYLGRMTQSESRDTSRISL